VSITGYGFKPELFDSVKNANDKDAMLKDYIRGRLNELGFLGYIKFQIEKASIILFTNDCDITSYWEITPDLYKSNLLSRWYYESYIFKGIESFMWHMVVLGIILNFFRKSRSQMQSFIKFYPLVILVIILFTETSSRYLIGSLPILCAAAASGFTTILKKDIM
jgi:hypothetical protein